jgi:hypothetical protein
VIVAGNLSRRASRALAQWNIDNFVVLRLPKREAAGRSEAFDDYPQGRYLYWNKRTKENLEKAIAYFQSAIKEYPTYAQAYAGIGCAR